MDRLRKWIARLFNRAARPACTAADSKIECATGAVAQVQEALQKGEEGPRVSDLNPNPKSLRKTLNDVPILSDPTPLPHNRDRHWFDGKGYHLNQKAPTNTWNRLEAFLSTTDPETLTKLDPSWNKRLDEPVEDDRPAPRKTQPDIPMVRPFPRSEKVEHITLPRISETLP